MVLGQGDCLVTAFTSRVRSLGSGAGCSELVPAGNLCSPSEGGGGLAQGRKSKSTN